jgi:hypothetical protein
VTVKAPYHAVSSRITPAIRLLTITSNPLDMRKSHRFEESGEILRM